MDHQNAAESLPPAPMCICSTHDIDTDCPKCNPNLAPLLHVEGKDKRRYPIGGDPKYFCICDHHEMCHANYSDMVRACNQTGCACRSYQLESADPKPTPVEPLKLPDNGWTAEQRYIVAKQICATGEEAGIEFFGRHPEVGFRIAMNLQRDLNALQLPSSISTGFPQPVVSDSDVEEAATYGSAFHAVRIAKELQEWRKWAAEKVEGESR